MSTGRTSPFDILGLDLDASDEDVRKAYRRQAMRYHPDRNSDKDAEQEFKRIQMSYQLLKTAASRKTVRELMAVQSRMGRRSSAPDPGFKDIGKQEFDRARYSYANASSHHYQETASDVAKFAWYELLLGTIILVRIEHLPLRMLLLVPVMLVAHIAHAEAVTTELFWAGLWQGTLLALLVDIYQQISMRFNRYYLRRIINFYVVALVLLSPVTVFATLFYNSTVQAQAAGERLRSVIGFDPGELWWAHLLAMAAGLYLWLVYCVFFDKHGTLWESLLACLLVGTCGYLVIFRI